MRIQMSSTEVGFGGGEKIYIDLAVEFRKLGHTVTNRVLGNSELFKALTVQKFQTEHRRNGDPRPDVVIANDFASVLKNWRLTSKTKFICHGDWQLTPKMAWFLRIFRIPVFCISTDVLAHASRQRILKGNQLRILPYGPGSTFTFATEDSKAHARAQLGIANEEFVAIWVGRHHSVKRLDLFLDACRKTSTKPLVCLAGNFRSEDEEASELAVQELLQRSEALVIKNANTADVLAAGDVFVSTSSSESLGLALMEAVAVGLPVICIATGGVRDFLRPNLNALWKPGATWNFLIEGLLEAQSKIGFIWKESNRENNSATLRKNRSPYLAARYLTSAK